MNTPVKLMEKHAIHAEEINNLAADAHSDLAKNLSESIQNSTSGISYMVANQIYIRYLNRILVRATATYMEGNQESKDLLDAVTKAHRGRAEDAYLSTTVNMKTLQAYTLNAINELDNIRFLAGECLFASDFWED